MAMTGTHHPSLTRRLKAPEYFDTCSVETIATLIPFSPLLSTAFSGLKIVMPRAFALSMTFCSVGETLMTIWPCCSNFWSAALCLPSRTETTASCV